MANVMVFCALGLAAPLTAAGCGRGGDEHASDEQAQRQGDGGECGAECGGGRGTACATELAGRAVALWAYGKTGSLLHATLADTGDLPSEGGELVKYVATADLPALLHADVLRAEVRGEEGRSRAEAELARVLLGIRGLRADLVKASATAECGADGRPTVHGESYLANLRLDDTGDVTVDGTANQAVDIPGVLRVVINEQIPTVEGDRAFMTVNALHVTLLNEQEIILGSAEAGVTCQCPRERRVNGI